MLGFTFLVMLVAAAAAVLMWGQAPEWLAFVALTVGVIATAMVGYGAIYLAGIMRWNVFAVDVVLLGALLGLAMYANRIWPLWFSALQAVTVLAHLANLVDGGKHPWAYAASIQVTGMVMPVCLAFGAYCDHRRRKRGERWAPWSSA